MTEGNPERMHLREVVGAKTDASSHVPDDTARREKEADARPSRTRVRHGRSICVAKSTVFRGTESKGVVEGGISKGVGEAFSLRLRLRNRKRGKDPVREVDNTIN